MNDNEDVSDLAIRAKKEPTGMNKMDVLAGKLLEASTLAHDLGLLAVKGRIDTLSKAIGRSDAVYQPPPAEPVREGVPASGAKADTPTASSV